MFHDLFNALEATLFMVFFAGLFSVILGFPISVSILKILHQRAGWTAIFLYNCFNKVISLICSIPYLVIMIALIPMTHWLSDNNGHFAAILPLTLAGVPLFTRMCTEAFARVPKGLIDSAISLGATPRHLVFKVIIPEALADIIYGCSQLLIQLLGFSVVIGVLGGGGIGKLLFEKGFQDYQTDYVFVIIITLLCLVLLIQYAGQFISFGSFNRVEKSRT